MNHYLNLKLRTVYYIIIATIYLILCSLFRKNFTYLDAIVISFLFLFYYLANISKFNAKVKYVNVIILSIIINGVVFVMLCLGNKNIEYLKIFISFTIVQLFSNYILRNFKKYKINTLVIGTTDNSREKVKNIVKKSDDLEYVGYVDENESEEKYLGNFDNLKEIVDKYKIEKIIFTSRKQAKKYADIIVEIKLNGVEVIDYLGFLEKYEGKVDADRIDALWILMSDGFRLSTNEFEKRVKRAFDIIVSILIGIVTSPIMLLSYLFIKLDKGPALFKQSRVGINGIEFILYKFRSMIVDAEKDGAVWAEENDNRVTTYGNFMRKTRIDELPQLWNVLRGEMSFVGPRPERKVFIDEIEKNVPNYNIRHAVKPGLTGWAQVTFPYGASIEDSKHKLEYDLYYIKYQNLWLDIIILFKTMQIVIFSRGR